MAKGPGGHEADATGPHGRGAGPGGGTGTAKAYSKEDEAVEKPTLEGRVTGPGGNEPDAAGTKGYGMGAGPGGGKETGTGLSFQEEVKSLYNQYSGERGTIDSYISQYYSEATKLKLTGTDRWNYVLRKVKDKMRKEKARIEEDKEEKTSNNPNSDKEKPLEQRVDSSDNSRLQNEYGSVYSEYSDVEGINEYVEKYHNEAVEKGYKGQERRDYVNKKVKEETKKNDKNSSEKKSSENKTASPKDSPKESTSKKAD